MHKHDWFSKMIFGIAACLLAVLVYGMARIGSLYLADHGYHWLNNWCESLEDYVEGHISSWYTRVKLTWFTVQKWYFGGEPCSCENCKPKKKKMSSDQKRQIELYKLFVADLDREREDGDLSEAAYEADLRWAQRRYLSHVEGLIEV